MIDALGAGLPSPSSLDLGDGIITTIRVSGIPAHTTVYEFNCWFLFAPGFEQATLAPGSGGPNGAKAGWARFNSVEAANASMEFLNGRMLTEDMTPEVTIVPLRAEMAKSQYKPSSKRNAAQAGLPQLQELAMEQQREVPAAGWGTAVSSLPLTQNLLGYQPTPTAGLGALGAFGGYGAGAGALGAFGGYQPPALSIPAAPPIGAITGQRTLYIGKLQPTASYEELQQFVQGYLVGFSAMKYVHATAEKDGFCLVQFDTAENAARALQAIPGYALASNPTETLKADFAKNELNQGGGKNLNPGLAGLLS
eukprot:gnl/MRDRNA2_/MRDRNA2_178050_c0_seq1.p1 gnl/MRDRNA2_/MRDRNA2_178050_c0~~gnl/MRDRNA2_/MRDRNA2_178050_c0_seq1.p1  ORF type:complete len:309 (-),score=63.31 gnl/MRDRNA2_/MRDRNA2_178050_c0_seq1:21-947(-)